MNKVSLLAASVALALTGCGSDDSGSGTAPGGITISAFDGYFKNAVMFVDTDNDGVWDLSDQFIGLTQSKGQIKMDEKPEGVIAIQTLTPGGPAQAQLISLDANKYAGVYTVDMDHPAQAMAHELVFRAPASSDVISPITDLSLSYIKKGLTEQDLANDLGLDSIDDLYTDFVTGDDKDVDLHKTAQLLTETKGANTDIHSEPQKFVEDAVESVADMTPEQKEDPSYKAPVDGDIDTDDTISYQTYINDAVYDVIEDGIGDLELTYDDLPPKPVTLLTVSVKDLFKDGNVPGGIESSSLTLNTANDYQILADDGKTLSGIIAYISGDDLNIGLNSTDAISQVGALQLKVTLTAADNTNTNTKTAIFTLNIDAAEAIAPVADSNIEAGLQTQVDTWNLEKGSNLGEGYALDYSNLFTSIEDLKLTFTSNILTNGFIIDNMGHGILGIQGIPLRSSQEDKTEYTINLMATNIAGRSTTVKLKLPTIEEGTPSPTHLLEDKNWYVLERGSSDGDNNDDNDYSRVWCDTYRFKDGVVLSNARTLANKQTCSETGLIQEESGTYKVDGENIIVTFIVQEENNEGIVEEITETATISIKDDTNAPADNISQGAKSILYTNTGDEEGQFEYSSAIYFADKADAEKRINVLSSGNAESRDAPIYWPGERDGEYILTSTSLQMGEAGNDHGNAHDSDYITFWVNGVSCDGLFSQSENGDPAIFERFTVTSDSISSDDQYNEISAHGACLTMMEGEEGEVQTPNAVIPFIFGNDYPLIQGETYSIMGDISDHWSKYISDINFNMTWDGKTNNE